METRFRSLRIIAMVLKILAWITLIMGLLAGIVILLTGVAGGRDAGMGLGMMGTMGSLLAGLLGGFSAVVFSVLGFLGLYAYGDAIYLALAIEENTRETAHYLKGGDIYRQA
jgi:hypothetical protein